MADDFCMKFITHKIKWEQGTNIFYCFPSLQRFIKGSFNQVNVVCHTYYCKKIEELFTLFSELPFLADLVLWLYYIVLQVAMLFLFTKIPKYVTQCSPSLREKHIDKNWVNMLQLFKG